MDLRTIETGGGGDLVFENGDIQLISETYNQPYLAHFGGNTENSTTDEFAKEDEHGDFWGNALLLNDLPNEQLNSKFQKSLNEIELSSSGRIKLERIANDDLAYLEGFADTESKVTIQTVDRIKLEDKLSKGGNDSFSYIWNESKDEVI